MAFHLHTRLRLHRGGSRRRFVPPTLQRLVVASAIVAFSLCLGTVGFMLIEGFSLVEAGYMTVITLSTVGFTEVRPLSGDGRIFTSIYIILNFAVFAYFISVITSYLFEGELRKVYKSIMNSREVSKLKDHIIVCGFGRNGMRACEELLESGRDFVAIDSHPEAFDRFNELHENEGRIQYIVGDATLDEVLINAGVERAQFIITTLPKDADNVFITLSARELNPGIEVISRATEENTASKLRRAGASKVVMPDALGGHHMAQLITKPYVIEFLDMLNGVTDVRFELEQIECSELKEEFLNKTIRELDIRNTTGATIIAIKNPVKGYTFSPTAWNHIMPNDVLIVLGEEEALQRFREAYT